MPPGKPQTAVEVARIALASPRVSNALAVAVVGAATLSFPLRQLMGWAGLLAVLGTLAVLCVLSLAAQWREVGWRGLLPVSLLVFVTWAALSVTWSQYQWATLGGLIYLLTFTALGIYVALVRDTIQIVRAFGDVLRFVLVASLVIEILAGVLLDGPIKFLGVAGNLDVLGPIEGVLGTRNQLGFVAVVGVVTFGIEVLTKSIARPLAIGSLVLAGLTIVLSQSPLALGTLLVLLAAAVALGGIRRAPAERRRVLQIVLFSLTIAAAITAWLFRARVIAALNAGGELSYRLSVWREAWTLIGLHPLEGWGWLGLWNTDLPPYNGFTRLLGPTPESGLLAPLDVWLQLGVVGFAIFLGMLGLTFTRSWLLASRRRSIVFAWPALILVVLLVNSLAESTILVEFGWLTFVVCCVKASRELSWRRLFVEPPTAPV